MKLQQANSTRGNVDNPFPESFVVATAAKEDSKLLLTPLGVFFFSSLGRFVE